MWVGVSAMVLLLCGVASGATYYLAPNGNDSWSGLLAEANADQSDGPLASLDAARLTVREAKAKDASKPITVLIRGGEYALDSTVVFSLDDAGTKQAPVAYRAYDGEKPVFTGGKKLTAWKKVTDAPKGVSAAARGKLWYCDIPLELSGKWQITSLYDGTEMLKRSRSRECKASKKQVLDPFNTQPKKFRLQDVGVGPIVFSREFRYDGDDLKAWENLSDIELFLSPKRGWLVNLLPLATIDTATKTATYGIDSTYGISPGNTYYVENAIDYLDEPGEWAFNSREGRVYLWSKRPLAEADIRAPRLQEFIRIEGVEDNEPVRFLNFERLTFRHGLRDTWREGDRGLQHDWEMYDKGNAVLRFRHAEDCSVKRCTFEASSGTGVRLDLHCQRISVSDSIFAHLGGTGIVLSGYAPGTKDENKFNTITNNYIHHAGTIYTHSPGIFIAQSGHNLVSHNTIHDLSYNGIVVSGGRPKFMTLSSLLPHRREWVTSLRMDEIEAHVGEKITPHTQLTIDIMEPLFHARENRIADNEIYRVMQQLHDGNGIYFSGMGKNNVAERNYHHDITGCRGYIRLDDHPAHTRIVNNVGVRCSFMFVMKGPAEYSNNFAIDNVLITNKRWARTELDRNIFYTSKSGTAKLKKKDKGSSKMTYIFDDFDRVSNCIVYSPKALAGAQLGHDLVPTERRGDADVGLLYADPMFDEEAMKQKIFRFKPGSPAEKLGIQPIDLSEVGSSLAK
jgi:hypothetical protein